MSDLLSLFRDRSPWQRSHFTLNGLSPSTSKFDLVRTQEDSAGMERDGPNPRDGLTPRAPVSRQRSLGSTRTRTCPSPPCLRASATGDEAGDFGSYSVGVRGRFPARDASDKQATVPRPPGGGPDPAPYTLTPTLPSTWLHASDRDYDSRTLLYCCIDGPGS